MRNTKNLIRKNRKKEKRVEVSEKDDKKKKKQVIAHKKKKKKKTHLRSSGVFYLQVRPVLIPPASSLRPVLI